MGRGQKGWRQHLSGGGPPPCVSGTQGGLCHAPTFPCPVGMEMSPPLCINGGAVKGGAAGVLRSLSCSTERGQGAKGWGGVPFACTLNSPFAHRGGVARTPRGRGRKQCAPTQHTSRTGWGRGADRGVHRWGHANVFACPLPLYPRSHVALHAKGEGADSGRKRRKGRGKRVLFLPPFPRVC